MPGPAKQAISGFLAWWLCGLVVFLLPGIAASETLTINSSRIEHFLPSSPNKSFFGKLEFLGGLELSADHEEFGGLSGYRWLNEEDGKFIAVTDKARVITGTLVRESQRPVAIADAMITRIRNHKGLVITGADDKDAESVELSGNRIMVGYERNDRIGRFRRDGGVLIADGSSAFVDFNHYDFTNNKGPEAIALQPETGLLYVFAEHSPNESGDHRGLVLSGGKVLRETGLRIRDGFSVTDAAFLPDGDLLVLERYYSLFSGVFMRIRQINAASLQKDDALDGAILIDVGPRAQIDNMEGMAISAMPDGSFRITVVSDDNFSSRQRTLLLEFRLAR